MKAQELSAADVDALRELARRAGLAHLARLLGVSRTAAASLLADRARAGTRRLALDALPQVAAELRASLRAPGADE